MPGASDSELDPQDNAETFDETHTSEAAEMRTFEDMDAVVDVTRQARDADEDEADDSGVEVFRGAEVDDLDRKADAAADQSDPHTEKNLDEGLRETFPASDPVSISRSSD